MPAIQCRSLGDDWVVVYVVREYTRRISTFFCDLRVCFLPELECCPVRCII